MDAANPDVSSLLRPGEITEVVGRLSSGRTSLFLACLREVTRRGALAALVDTDHALDPRSAGRAGVDLARLLWVRCGGAREAALRATDHLVRCRGFGLVVLDTGESPPSVPVSRAFRLKFAVRRSGMSLLVVGRRRIVGSCATVAIESARSALEWSGPGSTPTSLARMQTRLTWLRGAQGTRAACEWIA
jgi:hypothetical protein